MGWLKKKLKTWQLKKKLKKNNGFSDEQLTDEYLRKARIRFELIKIKHGIAMLKIKRMETLITTLVIFSGLVIFIVAMYR